MKITKKLITEDIISVLIAFMIIIFVYLILLKFVPDNGFTEGILGITGRTMNSTCDTGRPEIAGDFKAPDNIFTQRICAIEDCVAFNKAQNDSRCVV